MLKWVGELSQASSLMLGVFLEIHSEVNQQKNTCGFPVDLNLGRWVCEYLM